MTAVAREQVFTKDHPCPICRGHKDLPHGQHVRCHGFLSASGDYARCTREEYAGDLRPGPDGKYPHRLAGLCNCGQEHGQAPPVTRTPSSSRPKASAASRPGPKHLGPLKYVTTVDGCNCGDYLNRQASKPGAPGLCKHMKRVAELTREHGDPVILTRYHLCDSGRRLQAVHVRIDFPERPKGGAKPHKEMKWEGPNGETTETGVVPASLPLWGHERLADLPDGATVIVCEGQKAADALNEAGATFTAIGTVCGAQSTPDDTALEPLRRFDVVLWPDADPDGQAHMRRMASRLPRARILSRPEARPTGDAADFVAGGGDAEGLRELVEAAEPVAAPANHDRAGDGAARAERFRPALIDWPAFWDKDRRAEDWLAEPLLPRGRSSALYSPAKSQKSLLALFVAARLATGLRVLDKPAGPPLSVLYFDLEMTEDDLAERLEDMGFGPDSDLSHLHYYSLPSLPPLDTPEGGADALALARFHAADLVIIDTTSRVLSGKENDSDTLRAFHHFTGLPLKAEGFTVWRLDHAGKDLTRGQRGTSAKADDVDLVWELTLREDGLRLRATHRRQGWIPETVDLVRLDDPLRYERAAQSWPAGTAELAAQLDQLNIPLDHGATRARKTLREAGYKARNDLIAAAIRYRKEAGTGAGTGRIEASGTGRGDSPQFRFGDTVGDRSGQGGAAKGTVPPTLVGDRSSPDACHACGASTNGGDLCQSCEQETAP